MLKPGQFARGVSNFFSAGFPVVPSGSLDRNPLLLLIHFHKFERDFAFTSSGQPTGVESRIVDCGSKNSAIESPKLHIHIGTHNKTHLAWGLGLSIRNRAVASRQMSDPGFVLVRQSRR